MIVTIDGPAGSGKSTAARALAERLGFDFLDTGAMYRAVALACLREKTELGDAACVEKVARSVGIAFDGRRVLLNGEDVTPLIRSTEVTHTASIVAVNGGVRAAMAELQRRLAGGRDIVTEGRDQGTCVFADAECKFFVTAAPEERARRRQRELAEQGDQVPFDEILHQIHQRDRRDANRKVAPLRPAVDAVTIDTTGLPTEQVLRRLQEIVEQRC